MNTLYRLQDLLVHMQWIENVPNMPTAQNRLDLTVNCMCLVPCLIPVGICEPGQGHRTGNNNLLLTNTTSNITRAGGSRSASTDPTHHHLHASQ